MLQVLKQIVEPGQTICVVAMEPRESRVSFASKSAHVLGVIPFQIAFPVRHFS